ncbi:MAG: RNA degradosome polyphosphate kinase [Cytophagaceae bacterium SCN 52-12]|nr:MAG: RNA degradosome polyphosphate kinase [Cytophagaceae bacterium SCN 52-12]
MPSDHSSFPQNDRKKSSLSDLFSFFSPARQEEEESPFRKNPEKVAQTVAQSDLISRDLSWLKFNERVLDQAKNKDRNIFDRLKFLAITSSNLDEFFTIRVGNLYNYLDYGKQRIDYSGLREVPFKKLLLTTAQQFVEEQNSLYVDELSPLFEKHRFRIVQIGELEPEESEKAAGFFDRTVYPMLTPMLYDYTHAFPVLLAKVLILAVTTKADGNDEEEEKLSFVQLPANLPRFYVVERAEEVLFVPIESIVRSHIRKLYRNVRISSTTIFRVMRNEDFSLEDSDDIEADLVDELRQKIKNRRLGRVVRVEIEENAGNKLLKLLRKRWEIDEHNIFVNRGLIDYTGLWQIVRFPEFKDQTPPAHPPVPPLGIGRERAGNIFEVIQEKDILLHHPYNNFEPVLQLLEQAAEDPKVLSIKLTIYRLAKNSRVTNALLKAAENGKHVAVLFEVKARFDEENNIREAQRLQKAGCFIIYGIGLLKTHTKLLLIIRNEGNNVTRYAHMSSGNYNEDTARLYTDIGLLTSREEYTRDISEFFNVITGHSVPNQYANLITAPRHMRDGLIGLIMKEAANAQAGLPSGICIKINSLEDREVIMKLYEASQAGVPVRLIVRGICCLRPGREGLSENIEVRSIVGDLLEHSRLYYFHNANNPIVYGGSADVMVRSFDRRIESLFAFVDEDVKQETIAMLEYNLRDNVNAYVLNEDGSYSKVVPDAESERFNIHEEFYKITMEDVRKAALFRENDPAGHPRIHHDLSS